MCHWIFLVHIDGRLHRLLRVALGYYFLLWLIWVFKFFHLNNVMISMSALCFGFPFSLNHSFPFCLSHIINPQLIPQFRNKQATSHIHDIYWVIPETYYFPNQINWCRIGCEQILCLNSNWVAFENISILVCIVKF